MFLPGTLNPKLFQEAETLIFSPFKITKRSEVSSLRFLVQRKNKLKELKKKILLDHVFFAVFPARQSRASAVNRVEKAE